MKFKNFKKMIQENFNEMTKNTTHLFEVEVDKDALWDLYLDSFPEGTNEIFRERREYDCSCCRQFIKNIGNAVVIQNNQIKTIWDINTDCSTFKPVAQALDTYVKSKVVSDVYISKFKTIGVDHNFENTQDKIYEWSHLYLELPDEFVDKSGKSDGDIKGRYRDIKNVFKRSLDEITEESVLTIMELIAQNSLYKGEEWKSALTDFLKYKKEYSKLTSDEEKNNYTWLQSIKAGVAVGKIKNHSIGTLLINLSEGMELDLAVKKYEAIVAPTNYKRPKAIFTQKMLDEAKKTITELGYMESLARRYATLDDITVNNILFTNKDAAKRVGSLDIFGEMAKGISVDAKKFSKVEEISITDFINNVLPITRELEVLLENKHTNNFVSLIASEDKYSKTMFKWNNNFSWAYTGNITDSNMKENVKNAGGKVDGVLRFSIQWNDGNEIETCDLDAHCIEPTRNEIYYCNKVNRYTGGNLDVDIINPSRGVAAVENITWGEMSKMPDGEYLFFINLFSGRLKGNVKAEIEFNGELYSFEADSSSFKSGRLDVAKVTLKDGKFSIKSLLNGNSSIRTKDMWGITTQQFVPVTVVMNSPNYWDEQEGIGHKHYFFMLKDCVNAEMPNGFYNEFLRNELNEHKRVFEALGGKMSVKDVEDQLSGLGFSSTKRNDLVVKVKGQTERMLKIKF